MRLAGAVSQGSGSISEDGFGVIERDGRVSAAWVFDGVTGINERNILPGSDAAWLVARAQDHLLDLASGDQSVLAILDQLVKALIADWSKATAGLAIPEGYDPPAACLILAKRYGDGWKALRLGDSCLLAQHGANDPHVTAASPNNAFDNWLSREARKRREAGVLDIKALLAEFRPQLIAGRAKRNTPKGYSILEADAAALAIPEVIDLGRPSALLLCTDGFYRAVDHYGLHDDASLLAACGQEHGVDDVLAALRAVEAADPSCETYLRFKPADDATAVMLVGDR